MASTSTDEITLFTESFEVYNNTMAYFRDFHDLYHYSGVKGIVLESTMTAVEQCAVDFRFVCNATATIAEKVSNGWIENCIIFFEEPDAITKEDALSIASECKIYSEGFRKIHEWVVIIAGRLHDQFQAVKVDNKLQVDEADDALRLARSQNEKAAEARKAAKEAAIKAKRNEELWYFAAWIPVVNFVALPMYALRSEEARKAASKEDQATEHSENAKISGNEAEKRQQSVKEVACKIAKLEELVTKVEGICNGQVEFWKEQGDKFSSFAEEMTRSSENLRLLRRRSKRNIEWLEKRKKALDTYYAEMVRVASGYNFTTSLKPGFPLVDVLPRLTY